MHTWTRLTREGEGELTTERQKNRGFASLVLAVVLYLPLLAFAVQELPATRPVIRVSGDPAWAPIDFTLPGGKHSGLSEDLLTRMGDRLGVNFVYQPSSSWEEAVASLQRGDIDLLCAVGRSAHQEQQFSLSRPYLRFRNVIVGRREGPAITSLGTAAGKTFALVPSYTETGLALNAQPQLKVLAVASTEASLEAVAAGRAEATLGNPAVLGYALRSRGLSNLVVTGIADEEEKTVHFAARKREPELAALINTGLAALTESEQSGLRGRWFSETAVGGTPNGLELTASERAAVVQHRRLEVVIDPNRAPFSFLDAQGNAVGLLPELLAKVAALLGTELHFQHLSSFQDVIPRLADGRIAVVGGVRHLPELEAQLSYSAEVYAARPTLFTRQAATGSVTLQSFAGQRFAVPEGASSRAYLQQHLPTHIEVPSSQYGEALSLLVQGKVDVVVGNPGNILFAARQQNINGLHAVMALPELFRGIYLATSKGNPALASAIGKAYAVLPPAELNAIRRRWLDIDSLGSSYPHPSQMLAESERVFIAAHPVMRVGYNDWLPIIYRDGEGNPAGVAADMMQLVAQRTGLRLEWLHFSTWEASKVALAERRVDLLAAHGLPTFNAAISFTSPYANLQSVIVTRAGMPYIAKFSDLSGRTVGVVRNSLEHDELLRHYPQQPRREADDTSQLLQMIAGNRVDVGLGSDAAMVSGIRRLGLSNLVVAGNFAKLSRPLSVAVRSDWPQLASVLQKGLDGITAEEREQTLARHIPVAAQAGLDPQKTLRTALLVGVPTLLALLLAGWMLLRLRREVGRRKQAEAATQAQLARSDASQRRLRQITDAVRGVIFQCRPDTGEGSQFVFISQGIQDMAGISWEEAMRHPEKVYACVLREDRAAVHQLAQRALQKRESCDCIARVHRPNGGMAWTRIVAVPSTDSDGQPVWNGFWIDITETHEMAEKSAAVERLLNEVTASLPGMVFQIRKPPNADFKISYVSQNIRQRVGVSAEAAVGGFGTSLGHVHPDDRIKILLALQKSATTAQPLHMEVRVLNGPEERKGPDDWQVLRCEAELHRLDDGELVWTGYALNASTQMALEAALRDARARAEAASRAKSEFLANMSHEIRTPMNAVIGFTYLALQTQLNSQQHDYIHKAHDAAQSLLGVINDILDLSKVEAGRLGLEAAPFDLHQVLDRLSGLLAQRAQDKGLEFLIHVADGVPGLLVGDALRLGQVLVNIVGNAIKFTAKGQVLVAVALEPGPDSCITLAFTVSDTGIGISPLQQRKLFTPFEQADASITRRYGGTGLGLSISRRLVELMGGQIGVQSALGEGTKVRFTAVFQADAGAAKLPPTSPQRERLLVVDDNASAREIALGYLRGFGFTVEAAASGAEALALAGAGEPFQLALIDWQMPGMDGLVLAAQLQLLQPPPRLLLLTAHGHDTLNPPPPGLLDGVLFKPVNPSQLLNAVLAALRPGGQGAADGEPEVVRLADSWSLQGVRLLLVEDNAVNQQVAAEVLRGFGAEVAVAGDGYEALAAVQTETFDLVLMDTQMPGLDGLAATRAIRALPGRARLPIVAMTAAAREQDRKRCLDAGMDAFVAKPFQPGELRELLVKLLAERRNVELRPAQSPAPGFDPSATLPAPELDGLLQVQDRAAALERLGSPALLADISRKFFAQTPQPAKDLALMAAKGRYTDAAILLHSLAGAAGSLGYMPLMDAAKALELCFHPSGSGDYGVPLARFAEAWDQAVSVFNAQQGIS